MGAQKLCLKITKKGFLRVQSSFQNTFIPFFLDKESYLK